MSTKRPTSIRPGAVIATRFLLERQLGQGSMGSVWRARHTGLEMTVAVKFMAPELGRHPELLARFAQEARAAAQIKSPHVVGVLDYGTEEEGRPYIAMEYLQGEDLGAALERQESLPPEEVARVVRQAARGLAKAHAAGIIHRDIKPENLFLTRDDEGEFLVKILDFGVAKLGPDTALRHTAFGQPLGSPVYMSPEQAQGVAIDARTDLFSLGVVAYQCLTGRLPFEGSSFPEVLRALVYDTPPPPSRWCPELPPGVDAWMERALRKDPSKRFQAAAEMAEALLACFAPPARVVAPPFGAPAPGPPPGAPAPGPPPGAPAPGPPAAALPESPPWQEAPLRQVLASPGVHAVGLLDGAGRQLACVRAPSAPEVPVEEIFQRMHALASEGRARGLGEVQLTLVRFASWMLVAHRSGDQTLIALSSELASPPVLHVLLNTAAQKLTPPAPASGPRGARHSSPQLGPPNAPRAAWPSSPQLAGPPSAPRSPWPSSPQLGPPSAARGPRPSSPNFAPESVSDPRARTQGAAAAKASDAQGRPEQALVMRLSLALGKQVGPTAHSFVKREMARLGTSNAPRSLPELLAALAALIDEPARRAAFLSEAREIASGGGRGPGK